jgi:hypothetical protein
MLYDIAHWAQRYQTFYALNLQMFGTSGPSQINLIFVGNARSPPQRGASERNLTLG